MVLMGFGIPKSYVSLLSLHVGQTPMEVTSISQIPVTLQFLGTRRTPKLKGNPHPH